MPVETTWIEMDTLSQWIHQHSFLLLVCALLLAGLVVISWFRLWSRRAAIVWGGAAVLAVVLLVGMRTPAATVSEAVDESAVNNAVGKSNMVNSAVSAERTLDFGSTADIEAYLRTGGKPTLVEFYSDYGIG